MLDSGYDELFSLSNTFLTNNTDSGLLMCHTDVLNYLDPADEHDDGNEDDESFTLSTLSLPFTNLDSFSPMKTLTRHLNGLLTLTIKLNCHFRYCLTVILNISPRSHNILHRT